MNYYILNNSGVIINSFVCDDPKLASELGGIRAVADYRIGDIFGEQQKDLPYKALEIENALLKAQLQAQMERSDFIEDCIAEMAMQVYAQ